MQAAFGSDEPKRSKRPTAASNHAALFGAMGNGIERVGGRDLAHRTFRALELERAVDYVQRTIASAGRRNLRVLVVGGEIAGAMERVTDS